MQCNFFDPERIKVKNSLVTLQYNFSDLKEIKVKNLLITKLAGDFKFLLAKEKKKEKKIWSRIFFPISCTPLLRLSRVNKKYYEVLGEQLYKYSHNIHPPLSHSPLFHGHKIWLMYLHEAVRNPHMHYNVTPQTEVVTSVVNVCCLNANATADLTLYRQWVQSQYKNEE